MLLIRDNALPLHNKDSSTTIPLAAGHISHIKFTHQGKKNPWESLQERSTIKREIETRAPKCMSSVSWQDGDFHINIWVTLNNLEACSDTTGHRPEWRQVFGCVCACACVLVCVSACVTQIVLVATSKIYFAVNWLESSSFKTKGSRETYLTPLAAEMNTCRPMKR